MTAHSIEPYCQIVPLMGFKPNHTIDTAETEPTPLPPPPPPPEAITRVRRILFGKPERDHINSALQEEHNRQFLNFRQKYSFDSTNSLEQNENQSPQVSEPKGRTRFPAQIEGEIQEHERYLLSGGKRNMSRAAADDSEQISQSLEQNCSDSAKHTKQTSRSHHRTVHASGIIKIPAAADVNGQTSNERAKPYKRQKSIKEFYNTRKTANNSKSSNFPIEVLESADPLQTVVSLCPQPLTGISSTTETEDATTTTATTTASSPPPLLLSVSISTSSLPSTRI